MENIRIYAKTIKNFGNDHFLAALDTMENYFKLPYSPQENGEFWYHNNSNVRGYTITECSPDQADYRLFCKEVDIFFKRVFH